MTLTDDDLAAIEARMSADSDPLAAMDAAPRLLAEVWRLRAELARVAGVAREAVAAADRGWRGSGHPESITAHALVTLDALSVAIPAPDRAAIRAAIEQYGKVSGDLAIRGCLQGGDGCDPADEAAIAEHDAAKAALLALVGIGES